jgi:hypothetical protein
MIDSIRLALFKERWDFIAPGQVALSQETGLKLFQAVLQKVAAPDFITSTL